MTRKEPKPSAEELEAMDRRIAAEVMGIDLEAEAQKWFKSWVRQSQGAGMSGGEKWADKGPDGERRRKVARNSVYVGGMYHYEPSHKYSTDAEACTRLKQRLQKLGIPFSVWHHDGTHPPGGVSVGIMPCICAGKKFSTDQLLQAHAVAETEELGLARFAVAALGSGLIKGKGA